jgi:hypothetical protein
VLVAKVLLSVLVFDDEALTMSGNNRHRMGYAVAFFIFFVVFWNFVVLLWRLLEYINRCKAARLGGLGGLGGM